MSETPTAQPTPLPWSWDGDDLWHFGDGYDAGLSVTAQDPHRFTGITTVKGLRDSPVLKANMALIVQVMNEREPLLNACRAAEELLGFHEGSEEPKDGRGEPVVWINSSDLCGLLTTIRAALAEAEGAAT